MIRVLPPPAPAGFPGVKIAAALIEIAGLIAVGKAPAGEHFPPHWKDHKAAFLSAQHDKCAYCESRFAGAYPGDVEHKRPKAEVQEPAPGQRGNRDDRSGAPPGRSLAPAVTPGYWWLAYRWENWLVACNRCNNWKGCRFPLAGPPQTGPTMRPGCEASEAPLLLDPHDPAFDPRPHLAWNECGQIRGCSPQGDCTIDVCGLDRTSLERERERVAGQFLRAIEDASRAILESPAWRDSVLVRLLDFCSPEAEFAAMCRSLLEAMFVPYEALLALHEQGRIP